MIRELPLGANGYERGRTVKSRKIALTLLAMAIASSLGCASREKVFPGYILVESKVLDTSLPPVKAEIVATPRYRSILQKLKSVAISKPTWCENRSAAYLTGEALNKNNVIKTDCGQEVSEIEKSLAQQGLNVISSRMGSNNVVTAKDGRPELVYETAKRLGAQVIFQINNLERSNYLSGNKLEFGRKYYSSKGDGVALNRITPNEKRKAVIDDLIARHEADFQQVHIPGSMLDISAIDADTGQVIWFYRGVFPDQKEFELEAEFYCYNDSNCYLSRSEKSFGSLADSGNKTNSTDPMARITEERTKYYVSIKGAIRDFAQSFASGKN